MSQRILIIEDEKALRELLCFHFKEAGYEVASATSGEEGLSFIQKSPPALIILDLMLPGIDGTEVCRRLKADPVTRSIPIVILTAKTQEIDRVLGFELGAEDYVTKPFSPRELLLRVRTILKRMGPAEGEMQFCFGPLEVDLSRPRVAYKGKMVPVTPVELKLLQYLFQNRGRVQSREVLLDRVWGYNSAITTRTVDAHVKRLREKLGEGEDLIETVRGLGYRFREKP